MGIGLDGNLRIEALTHSWKLPFNVVGQAAFV
jgi:hypothetical protein